jgi:signal transduction histidine kinase
MANRTPRDEGHGLAPREVSPGAREARQGEALLEQLGIDAQARAQRLAFLEWGPDDEARLAEIQAFARAHVDEIVDAFYDHLLGFAETRALLRDDAQVRRLKSLQRAYFLRLAEGRLDAEYFESRLRVGAAHARTDLKPHWYLGTFNLYLRLLMDRLRVHFSAEPDRLLPLLASLSKIIFLDVGLAVDAYILDGYVARALAHEYRRMAEAAERTLEDKAAVERMKADLTNMIVHDLKGPLGGILTVAQLGLRKRNDASAGGARYFEQIQRSARDLMRMIENLLEIDQMQEGRVVVRAEAIDLGALLRECAAEFQAGAELAGQTIAVTVAEDVPVVVSDRWLLRRVLNNLVVNAIRHSGAAGRLDLDAACAGDGVELRVRDRGRGIAPEELATLFLKQARPARHGHREDTGLGLVFCKMAVEVMGGTIEVASTPGVGTVFTLRLPIVVTA